MVLRSNLRTILAVNQQHACVGHFKRRQCCTDEVIRPWTVDDVQLLVVKLYMENRREHAVAIFLLHREVVGNGVLLCNPTTS